MSELPVLENCLPKTCSLLSFLCFFFYNLEIGVSFFGAHNGYESEHKALKADFLDTETASRAVFFFDTEIVYRAVFRDTKTVPRALFLDREAGSMAVLPDTETILELFFKSRAQNCFYLTQRQSSSGRI